MFRRVIYFFLLTGPWICFGHDLLSEKECDCYLADEKPLVSLKSFYPNFTDNPCLTKDMQEHMAPWLLPQMHEMKHVLDSLFTHAFVIDSEKTLQKAGFTVLFSQKRSKIRVIKHKLLPGYLIKLFPNCEQKLLSSGWKRLTMRCIVAEKIKSIIARHKIRHFVVADKWLYPLPCGKKNRESQPVVLLVRNMNIYDRHDTRHFWLKHINHQTLRELYKILGRGYGSAFLSGNLPYTKNGKFAFIDTEYNKRKIPLNHVKKFISPKMRKYWDRLVEHHKL